MITLEPIGWVRGGRSDPLDDDWGKEQAVIELAPGFPESALAGLETFSHAEIIFFFNKVAEAKIETGARHPRGNPDWPLVGIFARVLLIPTRFLMPLVAMVSFVGIYGLSGSSFDLMVMIAFGILGWALRKLDVPLVPVIMGVLLGNQMEANLRRALTISNGEWGALFGSPLAVSLWVLAAVGFVLPLVFGRRLKSGIEEVRAALAENED